MSWYRCEVHAAQNTGEELCCLHDLPVDNRNAPGRVCCWCGDVYLPHTDSDSHGKFLPGAEARKPKKKLRRGV